MNIQNYLKNYLNKLKCERIFIAYSGGLDSHVLLHACASLQKHLKQFAFQAIHINHGLSSNAKQWELHCQQVCQQLDIPLKIYSVNAKAEVGESPEAKARLARYRVFVEQMQTNDVLLTAHHQDDQAETILLQLIRGSGVAGLAAMPEVRTLGQSKLFRPLLRFTREQLHTYATEEKLKWINDESNFDTNLNRNYLRHEIFPILKQRWPSIIETLSRSAKHLAQANEFISHYVEKNIGNYFGSKGNTLSVRQLLTSESIERNYVIRYWLQQQQLAMPNTHHLQQVYTDVLQAKPDANPILTWADVEIRRFRDDLYAIKQQKSVEKPLKIAFSFNELLKALPLDLPFQLGKLNIQKQAGGLSLKSDDRISIRTRIGGEKCKPKNSKHHRELKQLMQEWNVPPWERERIILIYINDQLAEVVGYCQCEPFIAHKQQGWVFIKT